MRLDLHRALLLLLEDNVKGKDWWEEPRNLREKLLISKFNASSMKPMPGEVMIRRGNHNWTKWEYIHKSSGGYTTTLHFWKTPQGERVEPKFKYVAPSKAFQPRSVIDDSPINYEIQKHDLPKNLREKLVYEIVMSGESPENEQPIKFKPKKKPFIDLYARGWRKWMHRHESKTGCVTVVHFWRSKKGERIFPKFSRVKQKAGLARVCEAEAPNDVWWEEPRNLREQLVLKIWRKTIGKSTSKSLGPSEKMVWKDGMKSQDPTRPWYRKKDWQKLSWTHVSSSGRKTVMHYWKGPEGKRSHPKFKIVKQRNRG